MSAETPSPKPREPQTMPSFFAARPTRLTLFLRNFLPWQMWRFTWINLKMLIIIRRSHRSQ